MLFFKILPFFALPAVTLAVPAAAAAPASVNAKEIRSAVATELIERQLDLSSLVGIAGDLGDTLKAVTSLLNAETVNDIGIVVHSLADLLGDGTAGKTKELINNASDLLSGDLIDSITSLLTPDLIKSVGSLLKPDTVTTISNLLTNAGNLLTPEFVDNTKGLIGDVAPVSPSNIKRQ